MTCINSTEALKKFCKTFPCSIEEKSGGYSNLLSYKVHGKNFAYFKTSEPEKWRFSIKTTSGRFLELTDQPGIKPARYMGRFHWVTIVNVKSMLNNTQNTPLCGGGYKAMSTSGMIK